MFTRGGAAIAYVLASISLTSCVERGAWYHRLVEINGVKSAYEDLRYPSVQTTVSLDNGGLIEFHDLKSEDFIQSDQIYVSEIREVAIHCRFPGQVTGVISGYNIVTILSQLSANEPSVPPITNVQQLVEHYDQVAALLRLLPDRTEPGRKISFRYRYPIDWTCYRIDKALRN